MVELDNADRECNQGFGSRSTPSVGETMRIVSGGIDRCGVAMKRRKAHRVVDRVLRDGSEGEVPVVEPRVSYGVGAIYRRELPGGGYVAIDVERERELARTRVSVERRAEDERRDGHQPVVIAEADGDDRSPGFTDLYRLAANNAAIARALLEIVGPERAD